MGNQVDYDRLSFDDIIIYAQYGDKSFVEISQRGNDNVCLSYEQVQRLNSYLALWLFEQEKKQ